MTLHAAAAACVVAVMTFYTGCGAHGVDIIYDVSRGYRFSSAERRAIEAATNEAETEVRRVLPGLPSTLVLRVAAANNVIPETGESGTTGRPNVLEWRVDVHRKEGVLHIIQTRLRPFLFYGFHHLVRDNAVQSASLMDHVVTEGLATVFERDVAGDVPPWSVYPAEASEWAAELMALPPTTPAFEWMTGPTAANRQRRWMGIRAGSFLVDHAMRASGKSSAELVSTPAEDIVRMARGDWCGRNGASALPCVSGGSSR